MITAISYYYVSINREDWGAKGEWFKPLCFTTEELADAYATREVLKRVGEPGAKLVFQPRDVSFDGDRDYDRKRRDESEQATYEVTNWRVGKVREGYVGVTWDECERITMTPERTEKHFNGYRMEDRETTYKAVRETCPVRGVAQGFMVEGVYVDLHDELPSEAS